MNSQQLLHFKQKMMKDFFRLNYEHFTSENDTTPEPNDTDKNSDTSMVITETIDNTTAEEIDENTDNTELAPIMGPVMSTTEIDDNNYSTTRRQGLGGRYLS